MLGGGPAPISEPLLIRSFGMTILSRLSVFSAYSEGVLQSNDEWGRRMSLDFNKSL